MSVAEIYTREVRTELKRFATWEPGMPMHLGDYGELRGSIFTRIGSITDSRFGLTFAVRADDTDDSVSYTSRTGVSLEFGAGASAGALAAAPVQGRALLNIGFTRANAIMFNAAGVAYDTVADQAALAEQILALYRDGRWDRRHAVVTQIVRSASTTVIVAASATAGMVLEAQGDTPRIDLADATVQLAVRSSNDIAYKAVTRAGMTPLLGLASVRPRGLFWWRRDELRQRLGFTGLDAEARPDDVPAGFQALLDERADDLLGEVDAARVPFADAFALEPLQPLEPVRSAPPGS